MARPWARHPFFQLHLGFPFWSQAARQRAELQPPTHAHTLLWTHTGMNVPSCVCTHQQTYPALPPTDPDAEDLADPNLPGPPVAEGARVAGHGLRARCLTRNWTRWETERRVQKETIHPRKSYKMNSSCAGALRGGCWVCGWGVSAGVLAMNAANVRQCIIVWASLTCILHRTHCPIHRPLHSPHIIRMQPPSLFPTHQTSCCLRPTNGRWPSPARWGTPTTYSDQEGHQQMAGWTQPRWGDYHSHDGERYTRRQVLGLHVNRQHEHLPRPHG